MIELRPYQQEIVSAVHRGFDEFDRQLVVVPTGGGKTIIFSALASDCSARGERTLILAHREELVDQAIDKLYRSTGIAAGKEKAEWSASLRDSVVVASVQSMQRRLDKWPADHFGLIVCDEAHHAISPSWQSVLQHFVASVLGVTATPDRGDKKNLSQYFQSVAAEISLFDLIHQGYLSRISVKSIPLQIDLRSVDQSKGDYDAKQTGDALLPHLQAVARAIHEEAAFRRTLVFLPLIATSKAFVEACRSEGLTACHIDGEDDDRKEKLARFANGEFDVMANAMLLTEGYDDPGIDCVVVLRPTRSRALYSQMVGRGTRVAPAKSNLLLLDFLWLHEKHNLVRPANLIAETEDVAQIITELSQRKSGGGEQEELDLEILATDAQSAREERLRAELERHKNKKSKYISAEEFALNNHVSALADYEPVMPWERGVISEKQAKCLKRAGIDIATVRGAGHASKLLGVHFKNLDRQPASDKVKALMRQMRHPHWEHATASMGRTFMAELASKRRQPSFV